MKRLTILLIATLVVTIKLYPQMPDTYSEGTFGQLEYGFYVPENYDSTKSYPLLTYLHGWSNNYTVYLKWYNDNIQAENPCFIYTPKTPTTWGDWSGWNDYYLSEPMSVALEMMDSLIGMYNIDTNRLYIYGISMGGEGVFDLFHKHPNKFAAGMSVCGGGQAWWARNIAKTPFWMFHGSADNINPPEITERVYNELVRIGAEKTHYTSYEGYGHDIWNRAEQEPAWFNWMFSFSKADTTCPKPTCDINLSITEQDGNTILTWNDARDENIKANRIWYYNVYKNNTLLKTVDFKTTQCTIENYSANDIVELEAVNYCFQNIIVSTAISAVAQERNAELPAIYFYGSTVTIENKTGSTEDIQIKIFSMDSTCIHDQLYNTGHIKINLSNHPNGNYLVVIYKDGTPSTQKVISKTNP